MVTPDLSCNWVDCSGISVRSRRLLWVKRLSLTQWITLGIYGSILIPLPVRCDGNRSVIEPNSPTLKPVSGAVVMSLEPMNAASSLSPPSIAPPPIEPRTNSSATPQFIDPRVEQQVPDRSPVRELPRPKPTSPTPVSPPSDDDLGVLQRRPDIQPDLQPEVPQQSSDPDLGEILVRPQPSLPPKPPRQPIAKSLYVLGRVDYFHNSNVLASPLPQGDGALRSSLSLYYAPSLGPKTFLLALTEASVLRYGNLSRLNSDELRFKVGIYHQWTPRVSTELGWSYYQLSSAPAGLQQVFQGKRFFNEHSLRFDLVRQDVLNPSLSLTTLYQFRLNLAGDVEQYDRLVNNAIASLSYKLSPRTQAAVDYQYSWTHFTQQSRDDHAHFLGARMSQNVNDRLQVSIFGGRNFGTSSETRVNLTGWILGVGLGFNMPIL